MTLRNSRALAGGLGLLLFSFMITGAHADLYVSAARANSVMRFDEDGTFLGNFVQPGAGELGDPQGIAFGPNGNLFVASNGSDNVLEFDGSNGEFVRVFASRDDWAWPAEINFRDGLLYVSDFRGGGTVTRFDAFTGDFVDVFISNLGGPDGQAWDDKGNIYISQFGPSRVSLHDGENGAFIENFIRSNAGGLNGPLDNLFLPDGTFLVSSFNSNRVKHYDAEGVFLEDIAILGGPQGLEIGPDGQLYAGSFINGVINRYDINSFEFLGTAADTMGMSTTNNFTFDVVPEPGLGMLGIMLSLLVTARCVRSGPV
jgi:DNA-binding beta-propeller fold protein YncE